MRGDSMTRFGAFVGAVLLLAGGGGACVWAAGPNDSAARPGDSAWGQASVDPGRRARVSDVIGEDGWLTLVGLLWLDEGDNSFGRDPANHLVLDHPALAAKAGRFVLDGSGVHFIANPGSGIT